MAHPANSVSNYCVYGRDDGSALSV